MLYWGIEIMEIITSWQTLISYVTDGNVLVDILEEIGLFELYDSITRKKLECALSEAFPLISVSCDDILNTAERIDRCELWFSLSFNKVKVICCYGQNVGLEMFGEDI